MKLGGHAFEARNGFISLKNLCEGLGVEYFAKHRALNDAKLPLACLVKLIDMKEKGNKLVVYKNEQINVAKQ